MAHESRSPAAAGGADASRGATVRDTAMVLHPCLVPADTKAARRTAGPTAQRAVLPDADGETLRRGRRRARSEALWRDSEDGPLLLMWLPGPDRRWSGRPEPSLSSDAACAVWCSAAEFGANAGQYLRNWCGMDDAAAETAAAAATGWLWPPRTDPRDDPHPMEDPA